MVLFIKKNYKKTNLTLYVTEKISKTKNNKIYVEWRGYDNSFNSWINKNDTIKYIKSAIQINKICNSKL